MLTLKQINEVSFRKSSFSGYKPEDVDEFIDEVSESFTALLKENQAYKAKASELASKNAEMREKMVVLAEKIEVYRDDEEGIKNALLSAQKLGSASIKDAKKRAEAIVADANTKADDILEEANAKSTKLLADYQLKIAEKEKEFNSIKASVTSFRSSLYEMYRGHISAIESIPDFSNEISANNNVISEPTPVEEEIIPVVTPIAEPEEFIPEDMDEFVELDSNGDLEDDIVVDETHDAFDDIDLNAYSDIPETLIKEKESLYSTLEFGDGLDFKK